MPYVALYRRWRPTKFSELVGQDQVRVTLSQAIETGHISHAYMFVGPRGTGKTSTAKILAKALNCEHGPTPEPCGECEACHKIDIGTSEDVLEVDAASNRGIDEIRNLRDTVKYAPLGRYKVYIIDEVHMLSTEAFNALLKTIEEPPEHVVFVLATTEAQKVPATIQSRCQRYDFRRITVPEIAGRLRYVCNQMGIKADDEALQLIALQADGGLRDALSMLDQCAALTETGSSVTLAQVRIILGLIGHEWIYDLTRAVAGHDSGKVLHIVAELVRDGRDLRQMLTELVLHLRSLMIYQAAGAVEGLDLYAESEDTLREQSQLIAAADIMPMIERLHEAINELRWSPQPRITTEMALLALTEGHYGTLTVPARDVVAQERAASAAASRTAAPAAVDESRLARIEAAVAGLQQARSAPAPAVAAPAGAQGGAGLHIAPAASSAAAGSPAQAAPGGDATPTGTASPRVYDRSGMPGRAPAAPRQEPGPPAGAGSPEAPAPRSAASDGFGPAIKDMGPVTPEATQLWQQLCERFASNRSFRNIVGRAQLIGSTPTALVLEFMSKGTAEVAERLHGKEAAAALQELAGSPLRLIFWGPDQGMIKRRAKTHKRKAVIMRPQPPEIKLDKTKLDKEDLAGLEKAKQVFGGRLVAVEDVDESGAAIEPAGGAAEAPPPGDDDAPLGPHDVPPPGDYDAPPPDDDDEPPADV